jgi:hypothetical protein
MEFDKDTRSLSKSAASQTDTFADKAVDLLTDKILNMPDIPREERLAQLSSDQKNQLFEIAENAIRNWGGDITELESAIGMLFLGHHFGWKVLYLIHTKRTIRKYEDILSIKIRDIFQDKGPSSGRSVGLYLAEKATNFWKVVSGEIKIPNRRKIE